MRYAFILWVFFLPLVLASMPVEFDYANPLSYDDASFYQSSDPEHWAWELVKWDFIEYSRPEIYSLLLFYEHLPEEAYSLCDYTLVDYEQVNQSLIDSEKYFNDLGCTDCILDNEDINLTFSSDNITHPEGDAITISGPYPNGTLFLADDRGITVILPPSVESLSGFNDQATYSSAEGPLKIETEDGRLIDFKGSVSIAEDGSYYVNQGDAALIEGVSIDSSTADVSLFFDGEVHEGSYVSFGEDQLFIQGDGFVVELGSELYSDFEVGDRLLFEPKDGSLIEIRNRLDQGLAMQVEVSGGTGPLKAVVTNGNNVLYITERGTELAMSTIIGNYGSVPMEILITGMDEKLLVDNDNALISAGPGIQLGADGSMSCPLNGEGAADNPTGMGVLNRFSAELTCSLGMKKSYNNQRLSLIHWLEKHYGRGTWYDVYFLNLEFLSYSELEYLTVAFVETSNTGPWLIKSIQTFTADDKANLETHFENPSSRLGGYATSNRHVGLSREGSLGWLSSNALTTVFLAHEGAHCLHTTLSSSDKNAFETTWYGITDDGSEVEGRAMYKNVRGVQGFDASMKHSLEEGGWVREYGAFNMREDVATTVEYIANKGDVPEFYDNKHYQGKVYLLCKYNFLRHGTGICTRWEEFK